MTDKTILDGLTDEERAAMEELKAMEAAATDDDPEVDLDSDEKFYAKLPADEQAEKEEIDDEGKAEEQEEAGADSADDGDGEGGESDDDAGDDDGAGRDRPEAPAPILVAEAPEDAEERLGQISEQKSKLVEQFDDGELTAKEYQQQLDALNKEERQVELALHKAQIAADMEEQRLANEREAAINSFLKEVEIPRDPTNLRFATLDAAVRIVANDEANAQLGARDILQKAYDLCVEQGTLAPKQQPQEQRKPKKPINAPKTLANMPAADITDTDDNRFAHINRIKDPEAREAAFMRLSPAEQEAFLMKGA